MSLSREVRKGASTKRECGRDGCVGRYEGCNGGADEERWREFHGVREEQSGVRDEIAQLWSLLISIGQLRALSSTASCFHCASVAVPARLHADLPRAVDRQPACQIRGACSHFRPLMLDGPRADTVQFWESDMSSAASGRWPRLACMLFGRVLLDCERNPVVRDYDRHEIRVLRKLQRLEKSSSAFVVVRATIQYTGERIVQPSHLCQGSARCGSIADSGTFLVARQSDVDSRRPE